eukprot:gene1557-39676_t
MCTAISGMEWGIDGHGQRVHLGFEAGKRYPCGDLHGHNPRIMRGCWAKRNGWAKQGGTEQEEVPYSTDQRRDPATHKLYDSSGDIISVKRGFPADRAGVRVGMRITQVQTGDPRSPLKELRQPLKWVRVDDPSLAAVTLRVTRDREKGFGATFRGVNVATVDPSVKGGMYDAAREGWPTKWPGGATGVPGSLWRKANLPAFRRGARPGWAVRSVCGAAVTRQWDIERAILSAPIGEPCSVEVQVDTQAVIDRYSD